MWTDVQAGISKHVKEFLDFAQDVNINNFIFEFENFRFSNSFLDSWS